MPDHLPTRRPTELLSVAVLLVGAAITYGFVAAAVPHSRNNWWVAVGPAGLIAGVLYWHRFRGLGFAPPAFTLAAVAGVCGATAGWSGAVLVLAAAPLGFAGARLVLFLGQSHRPLTAVACLLGLGGLNVGFLVFPHLKPDPPAEAAWWVAGVAAALAVFAWWALFRPFVELATEPVLWLMDSVRAAGPGLREIPPRGPCLVVANHACWADPFLLAKVLPRPITPVMTSAFYDLPVISWLMRRVIRAIRVPEKPLKQDVPQEIKEVIAALDRGECVVLFPEGYLRRSEDRPLKRFGRGVWQVLTARPDTPVFPCWIEGGWGSYTSYMGGPPTKNKRPDFRRPIRLAVGAPVTIRPDELAHHLATRIGLMNRVIAARKWLGLPELPPFELPKADDEGERPA